MKEKIINRITLSLQNMDMITLKALLNVITTHEYKYPNICSDFGTCEVLPSSYKTSEVDGMNSKENMELIEKIIELLNAKNTETSALKVIYELLIRL